MTQSAKEFSRLSLNTSETSDKSQQWFQTESNETIATTIQRAVENQLKISCTILRPASNRALSKYVIA